MSKYKKLPPTPNARVITNPKGENKLKTYPLFHQRDKYKKYSYPEIGAKPIDVWYDKPFYGRIDTEGDTVFASEAPLKQLRTIDGKTYMVMNYVAEAFEGLREYFKEAAYGNKISKEDGPYLTLAPKRGWQSPHSAYHQWASFIFTGFTDKFLQNSLKAQRLVDWKSFVQLFVNEYVPAFIGRGFPVTRSHWLMSKYCDPMISGLAIDIEKDAPHDNDDLKYRGFIKNANFSFFRQAAMQFGFYVDKNAPWRIYADLDSPAMQRYMEEYNIDNAAQAFQRGFYKSHLTDMDTLKTYVLDFYNSYVTMTPMVQELVTRRHKGRLITTTVLSERKKITRAELDERYADDYWIRMLVFIRAHEMNKNWDQMQFDRIVKRAQNFNRHVDKKTAMKYINNQFKNDYTVPVFDQKNLTDAEIACILEEMAFSNEPGTFYF